MKGIHPSIVSHRLNILPTARPVRQRVRRFHPDRQKVIKDEIDKLLEAGFVREVEYPNWLANVVVVPKKEGKWQVCVDYTNLNNACPKDRMLSFLDAFSGYHQIPMAPTDEEKTAFITPQGLYCYKVMPFRLKNPGATYQRLMTKIFKPLVGRTVEVYIDDIVVKSKTREEHVLHLTRSLPPLKEKKLYMYLAVSEWAISAILFCCLSPKDQKPIYYVNRALADVETRYSKTELTTLALRTHPVVVLTDQPLRNILHKPDLTGRMLQWAIELSMKGQVMADFVLEYSRRPIQHKEPTSRSSGSGVRLLLQSPTGEHLEQAIRLGFPASNNEAEYEAILSGLDLALVLSVSWLRVYSIVASLPIKEAILLPIHVQTNPSVVKAPTCNTIEANQADGQEWAEDKIRYLRTGTLPEEPKQAHKTRVQATCFTLIGGHLYKRSFIGPYLRCLNHSEALYVLAELHEGVCGNHFGGRSLAHKVHSQGYYWPTMKKDTAAYVKRCDKCQRHAPIPHVPSETLKPISGPWPFAQWGMDIVGPLPAAAAQKKFLLVATDYFSKWVEAEAYASIKDKYVTKFVWKNIICRFGIPQTIITDNGPHNGQAEVTNKTLITALKKRLEQAKGKWVEKLPGVLWAYRTTPGRPIRNTPFALAYGMDAVIPTKIGLPTIWTEARRQDDANAELERNLD
uniref:Integrase catalytic domain-containing protein n=1 Tax=Vitis vinifera TaxID=29760 RepID=A5AIQ5_VITVI|nr:hypothetical protein VITISV_004221 [Vitis vinifera]